LQAFSIILIIDFFDNMHKLNLKRQLIRMKKSPFCFMKNMTGSNA